MEYPIAGLITAVVVMLTALLFKRSNPVFWGVIAILLFTMFMGLLVLGASVVARRWMDTGSSEIVLAVLAGIIGAGASIIAMIAQKRRRSNWKKYGTGRSHRRSRRRGDSRITDAGSPSEEDADHAEDEKPPSLRELARAFSATRGEAPPAAATTPPAPASPPSAPPVEASTVGAMEAAAPAVVPEPRPPNPPEPVTGAATVESSPVPGNPPPPLPSPCRPSPVRRSSN